MEAIGLIILVGIGWAIFRWLLSATLTGAAKTSHAVKQTVKGNGSLKQNMKASFQGMKNFEIRLKDGKLGDDSNAPIVKEVQCRGLFPISMQRNVGVVISVFDNTSGELEPVVSVLEEFQEKNNVVYQHQAEIGLIGPTQGFIDWVTIGPVIPDIMQAPYGGNRNMKVLVRLINLDNPPEITNGFQQEHAPGVLWLGNIEFDWIFSEKGYEEIAENGKESIAIALKIGVAVAMADGTLDDAEGTILKNWIVRNVETFSGTKKEELKRIYNNALSEGYNKAQRGDLNLSSLTKRLNDIGEKKNKYEAVELCYDVMAADGVADENELKIIKGVAHSLGLNVEQVNAMRDKRIVGLDSASTSGANIEELLDINANWSNEKTKQYLRKEFNKWNNRLNTLPEGNKRQNAQKMLDLISEARNKYD